MAMRLPRVLVVGGGELGTAVAHKLVRSGMRVTVVDIARPRCIRRLVCFAAACYHGSNTVEGITARKASSVSEAREIAPSGAVPVLAGDYRDIAADMEPDVIVDARMLKRGQAISRDLAPMVIGLGPGFVAGRDVDVVIETNRGPGLGRLIYEGAAEPRTGVPAEVMGFAGERVVRAPASGVFRAHAALGQLTREGDILGTIDDGVEVTSPIDGLLRGLAVDGLEVSRGQKIGDVDPRGARIDPGAISDKGRAVAGAVLEAVMHWWTVQRDV